MFKSIGSRLFALSLAGVLVLLGGCGKPTVSGLVTLDGVPLDKGQITFQPVDKGRAEGAPIVGGKYSVTGLAPGKYRANVVSTDAPPAPSSMAEGIKKPNVQPDPTLRAAGNNAVVEITGSAQTLDMKLTKPAKK